MRLRRSACTALPLKVVYGLIRSFGSTTQISWDWRLPEAFWAWILTVFRWNKSGGVDGRVIDDVQSNYKNTNVTLEQHRYVSTHQYDRIKRVCIYAYLCTYTCSSIYSNSSYTLVYLLIGRDVYGDPLDRALLPSLFACLRRAALTSISSGGCHCASARSAGAGAGRPGATVGAQKTT